MRCKCCGKEIVHVKVDMFNHDGSDDFIDVPFQECDENAVYIDLNSNWTGYELSDEEQFETILCPLCNKFPFEEELQLHEIVRVISFKWLQSEAESES